jgi:hypothetical protein
MAGRVRSSLAEWELLVAGLLAAGLLALLANAAHTAPRWPPTAMAVAPTVPVGPLGSIYTVDQVLAGWHRHPDRWVGRTILVLAQSYSSCEASVAPYSDPTVPCVAPGPVSSKACPVRCCTTRAPAPRAVRRWGHLPLPIQLLPLPTYASWLNPIEKLWRGLRAEVTHLHRQADDLPALRARADAFLDRYADGSADLLRNVGLRPGPPHAVTRRRTQYSYTLIS